MWPDATRTRPPLGLPPGSVRALLTIVLLGVVCVRTARGEGDDAFWNDTLLILLAHYYSARGMIRLSPDAIKKLQADGALPKERNPLFLPKGFVRLLIAGGIVGVGVYLFRSGAFENVRVDDLSSLAPYEALIVVSIYLLGVLMGGVGRWIARITRKPARPLWGDAKAVLALSAVLVTGIAYFSGSALPSPAEKAALAFVLFYFGSR